MGKRDWESIYREYEEIEHPSDIGLRFRGENLEELFANAGLGMFSLITDISRVEPAQNINIELPGERSNEDLVIMWLEKLLYFFEVENMAFSRIRVKKSGSSGLIAILYGEKIDYKKHNIINSIKAPTYHMLSIFKDADSGIWKGTVIFDV